MESSVPWFSDRDDNKVNANNVNGSGSQPDCEDMNLFLWENRHDLTTRAPVMLVFAALYSTIILLGLLGNACVVLAIARVRSLQTVPNMFIFSLSCSDMLVCFISATITPITAFRKDWVFGHFLCAFAPFIAGVSLCFSTFTLAAISVDRFLLILFPTRKAFSHGQALAVILMICLLASGFSLPMLFMQKLKPVGEYCGLFCFEDWGESNQGTRQIYGSVRPPSLLPISSPIPNATNSTLLLAVQFVIPLALIIFCYTAISVRLGRSMNLRVRKKESNDWQVPVSMQRNAATKRRQRTNRMFIGMVIAFSLSWLWSVLYNLLRDYDGLPAFIRNQEFFFGILTHCIAMSSTVWNPILYALLNLQLRAAFIQLVPHCLKDILCRQRTPPLGTQRMGSVEESRLLGAVQRRDERSQANAAAGRKWLVCFINSSGSVESSASDPRQTVLVKDERGTIDLRIQCHQNQNFALTETTGMAMGMADERHDSEEEEEDGNELKQQNGTVRGFTPEELMGLDEETDEM